MISIFALSKKHAARTSCFNFVPYKNHQIIKKSRDVTPVTDGGKWKIVQCSVGPETAICLYNTTEFMWGRHGFNKTTSKIKG